MSTNTNMKKGIIMTEISAREFGKLQSDVAYLKETSDKHTKILEKMDGKLDNMVTEKQLNERLEPIEAKIEDHCIRIESLERRNQISDASVWKKIGQAFEGNFVKFISTSLFLLALGAAFYYMQSEMSAHAESDKKAIEAIIKQQQ